MNQYGRISHGLMVDALIGADFTMPAAVFQKLCETGFMKLDGDNDPMWDRSKLETLTSDMLVSLYLSLKNAEVPRVLP